MKRNADKQRRDWLEEESKKRVISFHHPTMKFSNVRAAIDAQIKMSVKTAKTKP